MPFGIVAYALMLFSWTTFVETAISDWDCEVVQSGFQLSVVKGITLANHNRRKQRSKQSKFEAIMPIRRQVRENACERVTIDLFPIGWESSASFANQSQKRSKAKPKPKLISFDTRLETACNITAYCQNYFFTVHPDHKRKKNLNGLSPINTCVKWELDVVLCPKYGLKIRS